MQAFDPSDQEKWQFWIDRGGTFTDIVARQPDGTVLTHKLLSENPQRYRDAAIQGMKDILGLSSTDELPSHRISAVKMGTTVATNALLERTGEKTLLVTTRGFKDQLQIGYQTRPNLFAQHIELPDLLHCDVLEVDERIGARGQVLIPLNEVEACAGLRAHYDSGLRSVAIVLMHGYRYHKHEHRLAKLAQEIGFTQVSVSHIVSPLMKLVSRGDTTVVDAYLSPVLRNYINQVATELGELKEHGGRLLFMRSSGGLTDGNFFQGKDAILSGPAGGVVGMARVCESAGFNKVIGFDMGGTSTDVSHYNGVFEKTFDTHVAGVRLRAPMMLIHTVAAGGGSILHFDGARYRAGPDSAGANPGPACYRAGGPLTITDCNVMLGKLQADLFPKVFGAGANQPLNTKIVSAKFLELAQQIERDTGNQRPPEAVAAGFLAIAVESMASAIKKISVQRGYDVSDYTLCCFGGAGGQHACLVADALGIRSVFVHPYAGVLSAYGMGLADTAVHRQQAIERVLDSRVLRDIEKLLVDLQQQGEDELRRQGADCTDLRFKRQLHIRYLGSDTTLPILHSTLEEIVDRFEQAHQMRFGFISHEAELVVESVEVATISAAKDFVSAGHTDAESHSTVLDEIRNCYVDGQWRPTTFCHRSSLSTQSFLDGPAVILDPTSTIVVEPGWRVKLTTDNNLVLERYIDRTVTRAVGTEVDPVMLEIFNNFFMSIAEQMGTVLENTAASVNIKERLDFSCAIFDSRGSLVANAPHVPVHLGSMSESIKTVMRERRNYMSPGDAYILNAPYNGGTHLPDITLVKPVFSDEGKLSFYVASRGHHADVGGKAPGSAPADSTSIEDEGIVIDNFKLVEDNHFREKEIHAMLTDGDWPARNPAMNIADLKAQLAACEKGVQELGKLVTRYGMNTVSAYMGHVQDYAEECVRRVLSVLENGEFTYEMDDGHRISVSITVDQKDRDTTIDFTGTSPQHPGNFNAPTAVVKAAVLYVFRCLVDDNIPLNEGCLKPIEIIVPPHSMISPEYPGAVFAGNVETSQYLVDALFGALGVVAASQGTMNNFIWGNAKHQYYETICGGTGATRDHDGCDAVHSHMTNSKLTDPEVLEWRFPVIVKSFEIRRESGGLGQHRGGDGVIRKVQFLEHMTANIISSHRRIPPYGLGGGHGGRVGNNFVERADGSITQLSGVDQIALEPGDVFVIETPGGGGYGESNDR